MKKLGVLCALFAACHALPSQATEVGIAASPASWRLQDYMDGAITVWFVGSSCSNGKVYLPATVSSDIKARFWSLIMTAKLSNKMVGVYYDNATADCNVTNFFLMEQ